MYQPKIIDMQMGQEFETIARSLPRILEALGSYKPMEVAHTYNHRIWESERSGIQAPWQP